MPANRRTDIDTGTRSLPGGGYQQHPTSLLIYQDISKISDISVSGETIPAQVKIVRTAHLGVDVKQIVRSIPIIAERNHYNPMLRPMPRGRECQATTMECACLHHASMAIINCCLLFRVSSLTLYFSLVEISCYIIFHVYITLKYNT